MCKNFLSLDNLLEIGFFIHENSNLTSIDSNKLPKTNPTLTWELENGNKIELRKAEATEGTGLSFVRTDADGTPYYTNLFEYSDEYETFLQSKAPKSHASTTTEYGGGTENSYGHCKTINNLNRSSFTNGEALSAYQGYLLNQNKASSSTFNYLKTYFQNALCEGESHENFRLQVIQITEPSNQSGDDRLAYLRSQFMSSSVIGINRVGIIRYADKNDNWYLGIGLKTTDPASRCQILVTNYFGEMHLLAYAPFDGSSSSWRDYSINDQQETGINIAAGQSYSFRYDNFCRVTAFRGSNWFDFTCDTWSALTSRNKTTGFDVTATCSNKTITIKNNEGSAINVLVQRPSYVTSS